MRFLTRNLDACVTYKIILPRCRNIEFVICKYNFKIKQFQIFGVSNVPNLRTSISLNSEIFDPANFPVAYKPSNFRTFEGCFEISNIETTEPSNFLTFRALNLQAFKFSNYESFKLVNQNVPPTLLILPSIEFIVKSPEALSILTYRPIRASRTSRDFLSTRMVIFEFHLQKISDSLVIRIWRLFSYVFW